MPEDKKIKVKAEYITKEYQLLKNQSEKIKAALSGKRDANPFWALRGVSFEVLEGDVVGIVGTNGSGKSTLLNIISNVIPQTTGNFFIDGEVSVVAIKDGLKPALTGRQNIRLKQLMMGKTNKEIDEIEPSIIEFSELGDFIDQPVKSYSSGMKSKLGFSIAVHDNPDIMIIDEALSVGDANFADKALNKIQEFMESGKTIFFVSHSLAQVRKFTNKVMWLQYGEIREFGDTKTVTAKYQKFNDEYKALTEKQKHKFNSSNKKEQKKFNLDLLREKMTADGVSIKDQKKLTAHRKFTGLNPIFVWTTSILSLAGILWLLLGVK
jgi:teichoic acid transport system ATP-binding protein